MTRLEGDEAILFRAEPALRRARGQGSKWLPAPSNMDRRYAAGRDVLRLVRAGKLAFGNASRTFVVPTVLRPVPRFKPWRRS
jgi:hypothetical protein